VADVPSRSDLEAMSSHDLHDLAMRRALRHADVRFLWTLLREIPAAEAIEGNPGRSGADMYRISALITDALGSGGGKTADALRPLYIDYLEKHSKLDFIRRLRERYREVAVTGPPRAHRGPGYRVGLACW
jgi:hypothetical protein